MLVVSQNVAKRLRSSGHLLVAKFRARGADVVALQEVTRSQVEGWCALLADAGYPHVVRGVGYGTKGGALLASRFAISPVTLHSAEHAGPRVAAGTVDGIPIASVYFPTGNGENDWSSLFDDLMHNPATRNFVLIGDFQMVVAELEISSGTFARWRRDTSFVAMQSMLEWWKDAFRAVHGPDHVAYSHLHNSGARWLNDHAFIPPTVDVMSCEIDWSPIDESLSDHATLVVDVRSAV